MSSETHKHDHPDGVKVKSGKIELSNKDIKFNSGEIFLEMSKENEEQRICLQLDESVQSKQIKTMVKPFAKLTLDNSIRVGNIPIKSFSVFLLSSTLEGRLLDVLISPRNDKIDELIRPDIGI